MKKSKAKEPDEYINKEKKCNICRGSKLKFKYLNNKKIDQPRYECIDCYNKETKKRHYFNPFKHRKYHVKGYEKKEKIEPDEFMNQIKVCPMCNLSENIKFIGLNNKKSNQPRYTCKKCKHNFSPFKIKNQQKTIEMNKSDFSNEFQALYQQIPSPCSIQNTEQILQHEEYIPQDAPQAQYYAPEAQYYAPQAQYYAPQAQHYTAQAQYYAPQFEQQRIYYPHIQPQEANLDPFFNPTQNQDNFTPFHVEESPFQSQDLIQTPLQQVIENQIQDTVLREPFEDWPQNSSFSEIHC